MGGRRIGGRRNPTFVEAKEDDNKGEVDGAVDFAPVGGMGPALCRTLNSGNLETCSSILSALWTYTFSHCPIGLSLFAFPPPPLINLFAKPFVLVTDNPQLIL